MEWLDGPAARGKDMAARVNTETDQVIEAQTSRAVWQPNAIAAELSHAALQWMPGHQGVAQSLPMRSAVEHLCLREQNLPDCLQQHMKSPTSCYARGLPSATLFRSCPCMGHS